MVTQVTQQGAVTTRLPATQEAAEVVASRRGWKRSFAVDPTSGSDGSGSNGSIRNPLATVARALALANDYDQIIIRGKVQEEITLSNLLGGIEFIGANGRPRYGDSPWAGGNLWKIPAAGESGTTPLIAVRSQGIRFENILFDAPSDAPAIALTRNALSGTSEFDASRLEVEGCEFASGQSGIEDTGGQYACVVKDSHFHDLTYAIRAINTAVAVPQGWKIVNNHVHNNTNGILMSLSRSRISDNAILQTTTAPISTVYISAQGGDNEVVRNSFDIAAASFDPTGNVNGASSDVWSNYLTDTIETGQPAD